MKRSNMLLFAYIQDDLAILLGTAKHSLGAFGDKRWLELLHDNYPEIIEPFKVSDRQSVQDFSPEERAMLNDKSYTVSQTYLRGKTYRDPGSPGITTSGHDIMVVRQHTATLRWLHELETTINCNWSPIAQHFGVAEDDMRFGFELEENRLVLGELCSNRFVLEYPEVIDLSLLSPKAKH